MQTRLLDILACPSCRGDLELHADEVDALGDIVEGRLNCTNCFAQYPIEGAIPRFVVRANYASSFGYQWNRFKKEQLDSENATQQSRRRLLAETGWESEQFFGSWIVDAGSGAGRFLDVASQLGAEVVGVDISEAIDASRESLGDRRNVHFVQASLFELPFKDGAFDACYCIGVLQHTPDPDRALRALPRVVKAGGGIAVTIYERRRYTMLNGKYLIRPLTRRMDHQWLLRLIRWTMPVLFPISEVLFRIPILGRLFRFALPMANYVEKKDLTFAQRYQWAILDTFDMLSPRFDSPQRETDARRALEQSGIIRVRRTTEPGLNLIGERAATSEPARSV